MNKQNMGASANADRACGPSDLSQSPLSQPEALVPCALNIEAGLYLAEDGAVFPVTNWFDEDGDECPRAEAVTCVAGEGGCWFALTLADFTEAARA